MSIWHIPKHIPIVDLFLFAAKHGCKVVYDGAVYRLEKIYATDLPHFTSADPPGDEFYGPEYERWSDSLPPVGPPDMNPF